MENEPKNTTWWKPAFEIASLISAWIVVPILLALIGGKWLDEKFHTAPTIFLSLTVVAFLISSFGIVRAVLKYIREIEILGKQNNGNKNDTN
ncbi:MAG: AtpZ/AtpI family protein [Patescibacteria group bacterium]